MKAAICTQCGAKIEVDESKEAGICSQCGTAFITEKVIQNYKITNITNIKTDNVTVAWADKNNLIKKAYDSLKNGNAVNAYVDMNRIFEIDANDLDAKLMKLRIYAETDSCYLFRGDIRISTKELIASMKAIWKSDRDTKFKASALSTFAECGKNEYFKQDSSDDDIDNYQKTLKNLTEEGINKKIFSAAKSLPYQYYHTYSKNVNYCRLNNGQDIGDYHLKEHFQKLFPTDMEIFNQIWNTHRPYNAAKKLETSSAKFIDFNGNYDGKIIIIVGENLMIKVIKKTKKIEVFVLSDKLKLNCNFVDAHYIYTDSIHDNEEIFIANKGKKTDKDYEALMEILKKKGVRIKDKTTKI